MVLGVYLSLHRFLGGRKENFITITITYLVAHVGSSCVHIIEREGCVTDAI